MKEHVPKPYKPTSNKICDQTNKKYYVVHYRELKLYIRIGMIISKVHRVVSFDQSPLLEEFNEYNTKKRAEADSDFTKEYYKGLSNKFFGKTVEFVKNRIRIEFVKNTDEKITLIYQSRLDFDAVHKSFQVFDSYTFKKSYQDGEANLSELCYFRTE